MAEWILGIETSCDETSAAVVRVEKSRSTLASLTILSQDVHRIFGGVVPELASRAHLQAIGQVVERALADAGIGLSQMDGVAVTAGPGLVGALLVGVMYGKTLAFSSDRALIGVNHLEGHLFAPTLEDSDLAPPFVALLVSGGHTMLLDVPAWGEYRLLGQTLDDAAGEAFDKVANLLGLGYPGGAALERLARQGRPGHLRLPRPMLQELARQGPSQYAFSFSGLKTAVLRYVKAAQVDGGTLPDAMVADIAASFQRVVVEALLDRTFEAAQLLGARSIGIAGGVSANSRLRSDAEARGARHGLPVFIPPVALSTDNAAMIGAAALRRYRTAGPGRWDFNAEAGLGL